MVRDPAPVALFAYRRPAHLQRTLQSLAACPEAASTDLTVFSDGPRRESEAREVAEVRRHAASARGFRSVRVVERERNFGLSANVIAGISEMLGDRDAVVVLEDDMVVSPDFLAFMNAGLQMYADDDAVVSIHGYVYPTGEILPQSFFLRGADCWGWATWRRGWALFEPDGAHLLAEIESRGLIDAFDLDGAFPYTQMLRDQVEGRNDSWAVRWYASAFLAEALTLYPGVSLVENIGLDGSGTHANDGRGLRTVAEGLRDLQRIPVEESQEARRAISAALRHREGLRGRIGRWLSKVRP